MNTTDQEHREFFPCGTSVSNSLAEIFGPGDAARAVGRSIPWLKATAAAMRLPVHVTPGGRWIFPRETVEKLRAEVQRREKEATR